jgi:predicted ATP-dependent endonuclease of OLD family
MRVDQVRIEGFRGIDRLSIKMEQLTTVIGEPDAGKSSLLHAIARVLDPRTPDRVPAVPPGSRRRCATSPRSAAWSC